MKFFIIHGAYGDPDENWLPWLKDELEKDGNEVFVPAFPTPEEQTLANWMAVFEPYLQEIDSDTIFIGHSLGPAFILSVLERLSVPIRACFFVSGFIGLLGDTQFDNINSSFVTKEFDWNIIKKNCERFVLFHSDNDPYVPLKKAQELSGLLGGKLHILPEGGHFNESAGYSKFPELLLSIKSLM